MFFEQIFEEKLAQYSYVIGCQKSGEAIVIDPMRDIERYNKLVTKHGLTIVAAADTHIHADYISGLREFAARGIKVYASDEGGVNWKYEWLKNSDYNYEFLTDNDIFKIGNIIFKAVHSPGHTPEHISYLVSDGATTEEPMGICSGDFIFVGDVGRPDLLESAAGMEGLMEKSARTLYKSLDKFKDLASYVQVWPGHGAGSACGKALGSVPDSTVGYEMRFNNSIRAAITEQDFVDYILDGQPEPPLYFARMKRDNKMGPRVLGEISIPQKMTADEFVNAINSDEFAVVIDTRGRHEFMANHLKGALFAPVNKAFNTTVGSFVMEDEHIYLVVEEEKLHEAILDLIRIGLDYINGYITPSELYAKQDLKMITTETITFEEFDSYNESDNYRVLDVRKGSEHVIGAIPGALNFAHTRIVENLDKIPTDKPLLIHCKVGGRAAYTSALLQKYGYEVVLVADKVEPYLQQRNLI
ncbi:MAG: MBL fold metallo-hydrolase [Bacteroidota bacterium]|nr:MBL fold metallo-hydrolase [Bacteroidota bacterium]